MKEYNKYGLVMLIRSGNVKELLFQGSSDLMLYLDTFGRILKINKAGLGFSGLILKIDIQVQIFRLQRLGNFVYELVHTKLRNKNYTGTKKYTLIFLQYVVS